MNLPKELTDLFRTFIEECEHSHNTTYCTGHDAIQDIDNDQANRLLDVMDSVWPYDATSTGSFLEREDVEQDFDDLLTIYDEEEGMPAL